MVTLVDLSGLATVFGRHSGLEQRHWWSVQVEFSCDSLLTFRRLVSQDLFVWRRLDISVHTARHRLGSWDVSVGVDVLCLLGALPRLLESALLSLGLLHDHCVWVGASRNDHGCVGAASHDPSVVHYVLREVLSIVQIISKLCNADMTVDHSFNAYSNE